MSDAAQPLTRPLLPLPGFFPDAVSYAMRLTIALLLAYLVSFTIQLGSASSAGVCVAIVMQPSPGMAMSKAFYRTLGTLVGGAASLVMVGLFPQDRTMLLLALVLWLGACTFAASLLRDFRAYGAVLAGYTVAIIAVGQIDDPSNVFLATLDRVAAILIGIVSVGLTNAVFVVESAHQKLDAELRRHVDDMHETALGVLEGSAPPSEDAAYRRATELLALRTDAAYATAELADGLRHNRAAMTVLAALLGTLAAARALGRALVHAGAYRPAAASLAYVRDVAAAVRAGQPAPPVHLPAEPLDAMLVECAARLAAELGSARRGMVAVTTGDTAHLPVRTYLGSDPDRVAAVLTAVRAAAAAALAALFCILANDSAVTLLLIQIAAFTALIGLQPNPTAAAAAFGPPILVVVPLTAVVAFLALPLASGFVPFALAVGAETFVLGLLSRHPRLAVYGPAALIYFTILLSPSNQQNFDLSTFANTALQLVLATAFMSIAFRLLLPVRPRRRLIRIAGKVVRSLQRALHYGERFAEGTERSRAFDRLSQAHQWASARRPGPHVALHRLSRFTGLHVAACRAHPALDDAARGAPALAALATEAKTALVTGDGDRAEAAARALLTHPDAPVAEAAVLRAASALAAAALLLREQHRALVRYGVLGP